MLLPRRKTGTQHLYQPVKDCRNLLLDIEKAGKHNPVGNQTIDKGDGGDTAQTNIEIRRQLALSDRIAEDSFNLFLSFKVTVDPVQMQRAGVLYRLAFTEENLVYLSQQGIFFQAREKTDIGLF